MIDALWLVKNGVPWDEAWSMDAEMRFASCVIIGEFEGNKFSWQAMRWEDRK